MRIRRLVDFTDPASAIDTALASLGAAGSSAVFDSLAVALTALCRQAAGSSSCSSATARTAAASAMPTRCSTSPGEARRPSPWCWPRPRASSRPLCSAAPPSRGQRRSAVSRIRLPATPAASWSPSIPATNLTSAFRRVLEQFRTSYVLYFTPRGVERQGAHTLEVRVKGAKVEVHARRGYVWR